MLVDAIGTKTGFQQIRIPVIADTLYKLSIAYLSLDESRIHFRLGDHDSNRDFEGLYEKRRGSAEWQVYERIFTAPDTTDFHLVITGEDGLYYIDAITIEEYEGEIPIVLDGDMENAGIDPWRRYGAENLSKDQINFNNGLQSIQVDAREIACGMQQTNLAVEAGVDYRLSLAYRSNGGRIYFRLGATDSNRDFEGLYESRSEFDTEWHTYERLFTAPDTRDFRLIIYSKTALFNIDDVVIEEVE